MRKLLFAVLTLALSVAPFVASAQSKDMTREEWLKIENPDARHVAYIKMSSDAKVSFWKDKFKDVKELKWSKAERKHIEKLEKFYIGNTDKFFSKDEKVRAEALEMLDKFSDEWTKTAEKEFGWSREIMFHIIADGGEFTNEMLAKLRQ